MVDIPRTDISASIEFAEDKPYLVVELNREPTASEMEQLDIFLEAFKIHLERNERYEDLWKDYGWMDTLTHVRSKAMRLLRKFWRDNPHAPSGDEWLDDAVDLINYAAFFIRNYRNGNKWGRS